MAQTIVNLTLPIVTAKIDRVLSALAIPDDQATPTSADLQQKLVTYVIRRLPVVYVTMERDLASSLDHCSASCYSAEQQAQIDQLIDQGLQALLMDPIAQELATIAESLETSGKASNWFG
ncbi:MAG: hypothetical protein LVS60_11825 [Nodosilinea sp. LVE1205-7]|jgi:hypothetical protein